MQSLREQVAQLTRRVYQLETMLGIRPAQAAAPKPPADTKQAAAQSESASSSAVGEAPPVSPAIELRAEPPRALVEYAPVAGKTQQRAERQSSLESQIGGQWLNRIGIAAVLVGLSYFLKFAFENNWIGPATQVIIGILCGLALFFWSERFRRKGYSGFAYSLKAVAFGALYLSLWASSQYYHLVPPSVAFFGMVMVTITAAALSLRQNSELLAAFALIGGFLTPILVSTGENHEIALFCYVALLDLGILWMVSLRLWPRLLLGSFAGTVLLLSAWASSYYIEEQLGTTLAFATFFFLLYAAAPLLPRSSSDAASPASVTTALVLLNPAAYFVASYLMLMPHYRFELAWLAAALAALFLVLTIAMRRRDGVAAGLYAPLYVALGVGFLSIAIPLKTGGWWLALGWLVEAGALFWASHRSRRLLLRVLGVVAFGLGVAHLIIIDSEATQPLILNPRFGLYLVAIAGLALLAYFANLEGGENNLQWAAGAILLLNILALVALHCEVMDYFQPVPGEVISRADWRSLHIMRDFTYSAVWMIYGTGLMLIGFWRRWAFLRWQAIVLLAITAAKVFFYDIAALERGYRIAAFIVLGGILLAVSFFYQRARIKPAE